MKQYSKKLFSVAMLLSTAVVTAADNMSTSVSPFLQWRSQGRNTARKLVGTTSYAVDQYDMDCCYGTFFATLEYDRSFRPQYITEALFGESLITIPTTATTTANSNSCNKSCNDRRSILIQGTNPTGTGGAGVGVNAKSWMAENFMLPDEFQSSISFRPLVQNILVDFDWYMGLDRWAKGLYFRLYGPVVNNRTSLEAEETILTTVPLTAYDAGYVSPTPVPTANLFSGALQYFNGDALPNAITGITYMPLQYSKFSGCDGSMRKTGFAELRGELGWNYLRENYRVGFNVQAAAPTGTRPKAEWLLEPQIGNGKHWELGVGLKALWTMWRSEDEEKHFDFVFEADVTHLFNAKQTRTFDLVGKPNSRYMLAEKLQSNTGTGASTPILSDGSNAGYQYANVLSPVANFSTRDCKVSIGAQGDLVAMFTYTRRGFSWDLGYNFWGMSHEKISISCDDNSSCQTTCPTNIPFAENTWALKGDAQVYGQAVATVGGPLVPVALAPSESNATIFGGTNVAATTATALFQSNPGIDNPKAATIVNSAGDNTPVLSIPLEVNVPINSSNPVVFITAENFDINGAELSGYSNKVFTHFNYTWIDRDRWMPYVGAGVSAEFGCHNSRNDDCANTTTTPVTTNACNSDHNRFALSQWAIWVKGGLSFH